MQFTVPVYLHQIIQWVCWAHVVNYSKLNNLRIFCLLFFGHVPCADGSQNTLGGISVVDDVKNESIKSLLYPQPLPKSDKHDELMLNLTRQDVYEFFNHAWNDVYWLASLVISMVFLGCIISHHYDLRMRMYGAQMRIACCSLIYRKVSWAMASMLLSIDYSYRRISRIFHFSYRSTSGTSAIGFIGEQNWQRLSGEFTVERCWTIGHGFHICALHMDSAVSGERARCQWITQTGTR